MTECGELPEAAVVEREERLRAWFTQACDPVRKVVDGLDIGCGGVQRWATSRMPAVEGLHLEIACGYATFLAQLGWRFPAARLVGLNIDFGGPHALARPLLQEAGVGAALVQADARRMPFADGSFRSSSCFLGLQDIEIGFGEDGLRWTLAEAVRVLRPGGALTLLEEYPFERCEALFGEMPVEVVDWGECALGVRWNRQVAERAIGLYADGWAAQTRGQGPSDRSQARRDVVRRMTADMEDQLARRGAYVPFGPVHMVVATHLQSQSRELIPAAEQRGASRQET